MASSRGVKTFEPDRVTQISNRLLYVDVCPQKRADQWLKVFEEKSIRPIEYGYSAFPLCLCCWSNGDDDFVEWDDIFFSLSRSRLNNPKDENKNSPCLILNGWGAQKDGKIIAKQFVLFPRSMDFNAASWVLVMSLYVFFEWFFVRGVFEWFARMLNSCTSMLSAFGEDSSFMPECPVHIFYSVFLSSCIASFFSATFSC